MLAPNIFIFMTLPSVVQMGTAQSTVLIFSGRGEALQSSKKSQVAVAWSEGTELALNLLDGIPELALSQVWLVMEVKVWGDVARGKPVPKCPFCEYWRGMAMCLEPLLIFQRLLFPVKDSTLISISQTVLQEDPWKKEFSHQRSLGNTANFIPVYDLLDAAMHSSILKPLTSHVVKKTQKFFHLLNYEIDLTFFFSGLLQNSYRHHMKRVYHRTHFKNAA